MTISYRVRFIEGSLFCQGQIVSIVCDPREPLCFTFATIRRIASYKNVTDVWIE